MLKEVLVHRFLVSFYFYFYFFLHVRSPSSKYFLICIFFSSLRFKVLTAPTTSSSRVAYLSQPKVLQFLAAEYSETNQTFHMDRTRTGNFISILLLPACLYWPEHSPFLVEIRYVWPCDVMCRTRWFKAIADDTCGCWFTRYVV